MLHDEMLHVIVVTEMFFWGDNPAKGAIVESDGLQQKRSLVPVSPAPRGNESAAVCALMSYWGGS